MPDNVTPFDEEHAELAKAMRAFPPFVNRVDEEYRWALDELDVLQVNITRKCNIACKHCHLECGPNRDEHMSREHLEQCLDVFETRGFKTLDITGGAPEMNPDFEWFIREAVRRDIPMIVRSNLVIHEEPGYEHFPDLYAELGINVVASLPHYRERNMEKQRGVGTFMPVIRGLQRLNALGYGKASSTSTDCSCSCSTGIEHEPESPFEADGTPKPGYNAKGQKLQLDLVFNPAGTAMPPDQATMEAEYKRRLSEDYGIVFDNLFAFTNAPGGRFALALFRKNKLNSYLTKLIDAFNPDTVPSMMCRMEYSVAPDGHLYDCDFNQAVNMPCRDGRMIGDLLDKDQPLKRKIVFGNHCYSCTAGAGSS